MSWEGDLIDLNESPLHNLLYHFDPLLRKETYKQIDINQFDRDKISEDNHNSETDNDFEVKNLVTTAIDCSKQNIEIVKNDSVDQDSNILNTFFAAIIHNCVTYGNKESANFKFLFETSNLDSNIFLEYTYLSAPKNDCIFYQNLYGNTTFRVIVWLNEFDKVIFTCSGSNSVSHIIEQALSFNDEDTEQISPLNIFKDYDPSKIENTIVPQVYALRVKGKLYILDFYIYDYSLNSTNFNLATTPIILFEYVQNSLKLGNDIQFSLDKLNTNSLKVAHNEQKIKLYEICLNQEYPFLFSIHSQLSKEIIKLDIMISELVESHKQILQTMNPNDSIPPESVEIIIKTLNDICGKLLIQSNQASGANLYSLARALDQALKAALTLLGANVETNDLYDARQKLLHICQPHYVPNEIEILECVNFVKKSIVNDLNMCLIDIFYDTTYNLCLNESETKTKEIITTMEVTDYFSLTVQSLHNIPNFSAYGQGSFLEVSLCHGLAVLEAKKIYFKNEDGSPNQTLDPGQAVSKGKVALRYEISFETRIAMLPRESYLKFCLNPNFTNAPPPDPPDLIEGGDDYSLEVRVKTGYQTNPTHPLYQSSAVAGSNLLTSNFALFHAERSKYQLFRRGNHMITLLGALGGSSLAISCLSDLIDCPRKMGKIPVSPTGVMLHFEVTSFKSADVEIIFPTSVPSQTNPPNLEVAKESGQGLLLTFEDDFKCRDEKDDPSGYHIEKLGQSESNLDCGSMVELREAVKKQGALLPLTSDERERVWDKREYLARHYPPSTSIPLLIKSSHSWAWSNLIHIYDNLFYRVPLWHDSFCTFQNGDDDVVIKCPVLDVYTCMYMLLPDFPDQKVRWLAISNLDRCDTDTLIFHLPQLVTLLCVAETHWSVPKFQVSNSKVGPLAHIYATCGLLQLLLSRARADLEFATSLGWTLVSWLQIGELEAQALAYHALLLLLTLRGQNFKESFVKTYSFLRADLPGLGASLKRGLVKEDWQACTSFLKNRLARFNQTYFERGSTKFRLPLEPGFEVSRLALDPSIGGSTFYKSKNFPLKLVFENALTSQLPVSEPLQDPYIMIYKAGDDLRQDQLSLQMIKMMDRLWLSHNLDLDMVTFKCLPLTDSEGVIEYIHEAETLRNIQMNHGLSGSFKSQCIYEWLQKYNTQELDFKKAIGSFSRSCAGYCVATYVLGICDRHNDNIMIKRTGHLIHIDFGKFLGDSQMFGNVKRDRVPFVLTADMAYVINQGTQGGTKFQNFIDTCCEAYNILRINGSKLLIMMKIMELARIPGVPPGSIDFLRKTLALDLSETQATVRFTKLIKESLSSKFTQFNFFIHGLMQSKDANKNEIAPTLKDSSKFSFTYNPLTRTDKGENIKNVAIEGIQKLYDLEKLYVYACRVEYSQSVAPCKVYRTYGEFCELRSKLVKTYALAQFPSLPSSLFATPGSKLNFNLNLNLPPGDCPTTSQTTAPSTSSAISYHRHKRLQMATRGLPLVKRFAQVLFNMAPEVSQSPLVLTFFHPVLRDQKEESNFEDVNHHDDTSFVRLNLREPRSVGNDDFNKNYIEELMPYLDIRMKVNVKLKDASNKTLVPSHINQPNEETVPRIFTRDDVIGGDMPKLPKIKLSLCLKRSEYTIKPAEFLQILVMHGKNLYKKDSTLPDPFVKIWLQNVDCSNPTASNSIAIIKRKTQVATKTSHPSYNDEFVFEESLDILRTKTLYLKILSFERFKDNETLGTLKISLKHLEINRVMVSWFLLKNN